MTRSLAAARFAPWRAETSAARDVLRSPLAVAIPTVWVAWFVLISVAERWGVWEQNWFMSVTMAAGSFIAGATSEGGGAVAFPVMTLVFGIAPQIARDFSLMIQSVGMTAASLAIVCMRIPVESRALAWSGLGGAFGMIAGLSWVADRVPPAGAKILFTSLWLSLGVVLFWINRDEKRRVCVRIAGERWRVAASLCAVGSLGGVIGSVTGCGIDILTFSVLVLAFNLDEKVGTPTSVILMASNAVVGALWKGLAGSGLAPAAWDYWYVCVPVVVVGAPLGAYCARRISRRAVVAFLIVSIAVQYVAALGIIPQSPGLIVLNLSVLAFGGLGFAGLVRVGRTRKPGEEFRVALVQSGTEVQAGGVVLARAAPCVCAVEEEHAHGGRRTEDRRVGAPDRSGQAGAREAAAHGVPGRGAGLRVSR